jgi:hypothetical protein
MAGCVSSPRDYDQNKPTYQATRIATHTIAAFTSEIASRILFLKPIFAYKSNRFLRSQESLLIYMENFLNLLVSLS